MNDVDRKLADDPGRDVMVDMTEPAAVPELASTVDDLVSHTHESRRLSMSDEGHRQTAQLLEGAAIALAARVLTEQEMADARRTNELLRQRQDRSTIFAAGGVARRFHQRLVRACPNARMVALLEEQTEFVTSHQAAPLMTPAGVARAADEHEYILQLIERGAETRLIEQFVHDHLATSCG